MKLVTMKLVTIPGEVAEKIKGFARNRGTLNNATIAAGEGNVSGFVGEAMFLQEFPEAKYCQADRDKDFIYRGKNIDVKTRTSDLSPSPHWDCKIPEYSVQKQNCDIYVFASAMKNGQYGYLLGWMYKKDFVAKAKIQEADKVTQFKKHTTNARFLMVAVRDLNPIETLGILEIK